MTQQNAVFNFNVEQNTKVIEIAGKNYTLDFGDDSLKKYQLAVLKFRETYKEIKDESESVEFETATVERIEKVSELQTKIVKEFITPFLGEESYDELYEKSGRSTRNLLELVYFLMNLVSDEQVKYVEDARNKYVMRK